MTKPRTGAANLDPTRTSRLRNSLRREVRTKFATLKGDIIRLFAAEGSLEERVSAAAPIFAAESVPAKIELFKTWVTARASDLIVKQWESSRRSHLTAALGLGITRAYDAATRADKSVSLKREHSYSYFGGRTQRVSQILRSQPATDKLRSLHGRINTATEALASAIVGSSARAFADAVESGKPFRIAATSVLEFIAPYIPRAAAIGDTEIVRAYNEGYLIALQSLDIKDVSASVEWTSSKSGMCKRCADLSGASIPVASASGMIPHHVGCRCAWSVGSAVPRATAPSLAANCSACMTDFDRLLTNILLQQEGS